MANDFDRAVRKYREFWQLDPVKTGKFHDSFKIPRSIPLVGDGVVVLYKSGKVDPDTGKKPSRPVNYFHDHDPGVKVYRPDGDGPQRSVPQRIWSVTTLVLLGDCLGFTYHDGENEVEAGVSAPLPELYCTPGGKALLVVEGKRRLVAIMWGGRLGVEDRGIVH